MIPNVSNIMTNYYIASHALMSIGMDENIPEELKQITIEASAATVKIVNYINAHKGDE